MGQELGLPGPGVGRFYGTKGMFSRTKGLSLLSSLLILMLDLGPLALP